MTADRNDTKSQLLATACITELREMSARKIPLQVETLASRLGVREDVAALLSEGGPSDSVSLASHARVREQKESLLREVVRLEEANGLQNEGFRRMLLFLVEEATARSPEMKSVAGRFAALLKEDGAFADVETAFAALKESCWKSAAAEAPKGTGFFSRVFGETRPAGPEDALREALQEIADNLRLHLDASLMPRLFEIHQEIQDARDVRGLVFARRQLVDLIADQTACIQALRAEAAAAMREIAERLVAMEDLILTSFLGQSREDATSSQAFSDSLQAQIGSLGERVVEAENLSELRSAVVARLDVIRNVIAERQSDDAKRQKASAERLKQLKEGLRRMRSQIEASNRKSRKLEEELLQDPLTKVYNRRAYDSRVGEEMGRFARYGARFSVLIFDVDHFKKVNDTYGHAVGDQCLKVIARRVGEVLRDSDFLARFGGEEFVVLLPETDRNGALDAAEKIRQTVEGMEVLHGERRVPLTVSVGGTQILPEDTDYGSVFTRMDKALYAAKNSGRNRCVMH